MMGKIGVAGIGVALFFALTSLSHGEEAVGRTTTGSSRTTGTTATPSRTTGTTAATGATAATATPSRIAESPSRPTAASGVTETKDTLVIYDFEENLQEWTIPDWARESKDHVGTIVSISQEVASRGKGSMQLLADFPGARWTGAYVETMMYVTDWSAFGAFSVDLMVPASAPKGLEGRIILTVGKDWTWTEMNQGIKLEPGQWTTLKVNLKPGSLDWKFFPDDAFRSDVRKVGLRLESNKGPIYSGPIYIDTIRLSR